MEFGFVLLFFSWLALPLTKYVILEGTPFSILIKFSCMSARFFSPDIMKDRKPVTQRASDTRETLQVPSSQTVAPSTESTRETFRKCTFLTSVIGLTLLHTVPSLDLP